MPRHTTIKTKKSATRIKSKKQRQALDEDAIAGLMRFLRQRSRRGVSENLNPPQTTPALP
jgi:hypothetical protein